MFLASKKLISDSANVQAWIQRMVVDYSARSATNRDWQHERRKLVDTKISYFPHFLQEPLKNSAT